MAKSSEERLGIVETEVDTLQESNRDQWDAINDLRKFMQKLVPIWTTVVLMCMSALTASALTFAGMLIRMNSK